MPARSLERDSLLLLHAPVGRDAQLLHDVLRRAGLPAQICSSIEDLCQDMRRGVGAVFLAEEALNKHAIEQLAAVLDEQGAWSDIPLLIFTVGGEPTASARQRLAQLEPLGDITLLERPLRSDTILSAARAALRSRAKQYELRRRDAELQLVTDKVPVLISYVDRGQVFRRVNQTYYEWFGKTPGEVVGRSIRDIVGEPHYSNAQPYFERALGGEHVHYESRIRNRWGELRDAAVSYAPDLAPSGFVRGIVVLFQDITERKRVERRDAFLLQLDDATRSLHSPREMIQAAVRLLGEHLGVDHCDYADVIDAGGSSLALTGEYTQGAAGRLGLCTLDGLDCDFSCSMRKGSPFVIEDIESDARPPAVLVCYREARIRSMLSVPIHHAGRLAAAMVLWQHAPRRWRPDEIELVQLVATRTWESVDRARVALKLRENEQRLRLAQRAGRIGSFEWLIPEGQVIWTPELEALYGMPEGTFEGRLEDWTRRVFPEDARQLTAAIEQCLARGQAEYSYEVRAVLPDGSHRWLAGQAQVFYGPSGRPSRMIGVNIDIDARRRAEEELRKTNRELEEFAYVASHDLQEPLRMINSYTQLLLKRYIAPANQEAQEYGAFIDGGVKRMQQLIRDLLAYSGAIYGDELRSSGEADLQVALDQALTMLADRLRETKAVIRAGSLPKVAGETAQLVHVFQNLISNAVKYCKTGVAPVVRITAEQRGSQWVIAVRDNGIGFEQRYAERIFGLFKRLHGRDVPGTGIGLAICQRIVERYGGRMWAESEPDAGSSFFFSLPVLESHTAASLGGLDEGAVS